MSDPTQPGRYSVRVWKRIVRLAQVAVAITIGVAVWLIGFSSGSDPAPLLPDTATQFSLDLQVLDPVDHDLVYAVEQRARPFYRIFSLDPRTGDVETIFTVPQDAIIYGIALHPDGDTLAVSYSPDFALEGSGVWTLNLATKEMTEVIAVTTDVYLTDPVWSPDGASILTTQVDRRSTDELLSIARISHEDGAIVELASNAINPSQVGDTVYYLTVDDHQARRSIGALHLDGTTTTIEVGTSDLDLDHLLQGHDDTTVRVAILETAEGGITFGEPASAHGNHDVASSWWNINLEEAAEPTAAGLEPVIVYDAATTTTSGAIVYATKEGLSLGDTTRTDLIKSRAIRFVAG